MYRKNLEKQRLKVNVLPSGTTDDHRNKHTSGTGVAAYVSTRNRRIHRGKLQPSPLFMSPLPRVYLQ